MRIKPTHLKACAAVLESGDFANAEEAAKAVIDMIDNLRSEDINYVAVRQYSPHHVMGYGPFPTRNAATKAAEAGRVGLAGEGLLTVVPLRSYESQMARMKALDELPTHMGENHWARIKERLTL